MALYGTEKNYDSLIHIITMTAKKGVTKTAVHFSLHLDSLNDFIFPRILTKSWAKFRSHIFFSQPNWVPLTGSWAPPFTLQETCFFVYSTSPPFLHTPITNHLSRAGSLLNRTSSKSRPSYIKTWTTFSWRLKRRNRQRQIRARAFRGLLWIIGKA